MRAFSASFPACIRRSHRVSLSLSPFPHPGVRELPLPGCFPSCRRHSPTASRMMLREHRPFDDQAPTPAARPDATAPPQCRTSARPDSELLQPAMQFRGSARLLRQKCTCRLHLPPKCFSRIHRPVRGIPSSEKTRTLRGYAAFSPPKAPSPARAAPPPWMCPPRSDKAASCPLNVSPPRSCRFSPFSHDLDSSPQQRTRHTPPLQHPGFRGRGTPAPPSLFRARFLLPLSCRRASFPEFSPDATTRRSLPGVILLPARPVPTAFSPGIS